ncbi:MAG: hypothetical protein JO222_14890 [Frankiales bacterium]|nr:hypothetical protein [Frankiales bacterium]
MTPPRTEKLLAILQEHFNPREKGWIWLALYADGDDRGVVNQIEGEFGDPLEAAQALARIVNEIRPDHAYVALCRREGRPREVDRELWRELRRRVADERLFDMVVFSDRHAWSMRAEDAAAA